MVEKTPTQSMPKRLNVTSPETQSAGSRMSSEYRRWLAERTAKPAARCIFVAFLGAAFLGLACKAKNRLPSAPAPAPAAAIDARQISRAVFDLLVPDKAVTVSSIWVAPDRTVWIVWANLGNPRTGRGRDYFARKLSASGTRLGEDIPLLLDSGNRPLRVDAVGITPDGSLVVDTDWDPLEPLLRLARVHSGSSMAVSTTLPTHHMRDAFVDQDGLAHIVSSGRPGYYVQVDLTKPDLPEILSLDYDQPFNGLASAPAYLRWKMSWNASPYGLAFLSEKQGRLLAAMRKLNDIRLVYHLYRIDSKTLALLDSSQINRFQDVYRTWTGPVIEKAVIVPAGRTGYWLFDPRSSSDTIASPPGQDLKRDNPQPTVVAYRLGPDLKVIRPTIVASGVVRPFADAPPDAVVSVQTSYEYGITGWEHGTWVVPLKHKLEFYGFSSGGQLYTQSFEDSITSRVTE